jgi:hypothetical protein
MSIIEISLIKSRKVEFPFPNAPPHFSWALAIQLKIEIPSNYPGSIFENPSLLRKEAPADGFHHGYDRATNICEYKRLVVYFDFLSCLFYHNRLAN